MQCLCGTHLRALIAEYALCSVFPLAGFPVDPHIHGADPQTLAAVNAQQRKVAHGLEKHRNGAEVLEQVKDTRASNTCKALCAAPASMGRGEILVELCQQPFVLSLLLLINLQTTKVGKRRLCYRQIIFWTSKYYSVLQIRLAPHTFNFRVSHPTPSHA